MRSTLRHLRLLDASTGNEAEVDFGAMNEYIARRDQEGSCIMSTCLMVLCDRGIPAWGILFVHKKHLRAIASLFFCISRLQLHPIQHIVGHQESNGLRQLRQCILYRSCEQLMSKLVALRITYRLGLTAPSMLGRSNGLTLLGGGCFCVGCRGAAGVMGWALPSV